MILVHILILSRKTGNHPDMTDKLLTGTFSIKTNKAENPYGISNNVDPDKPPHLSVVTDLGLHTFAYTSFIGYY